MEHLGLVGLPESRHGRLFAALTGAAEPAGSERLLGVAKLPDERLEALATMSASRQVVPATFQIAWLPPLSVEPGKGLGSRLLGSLRDCDALLVVVSGHDPEAELLAVEYELCSADLASCEQRLAKQQRVAKGDPSVRPELDALQRAIAALGEGVPVHRSDLDDGARARLAPVFLLTNKPVLVLVDIDVDQLGAASDGDAGGMVGALAVCLEIEGDPDVVASEGAERAALLADLGVSESVLPRVARAAFDLLGRATFFTTGDKESRAWTFRRGATAPECAGVIHSDLQRGFIRAEVIRWDELLEIGSWAKAKELGRLRVEGKDYLVEDGDVLEIRFNV